MRTPGPQPLDRLPPTGDRVGGGPAPDAADRPAVPENSVLRQPEGDGGPAVLGRDGRSQAGPATQGVDGPGGAASRTADHDRGAGRAGLPFTCSETGCRPTSTRSGVPTSPLFR